MQNETENMEMELVPYYGEVDVTSDGTVIKLLRTVDEALVAVHSDGKLVFFAPTGETLFEMNEKNKHSLQQDSLDLMVNMAWDSVGDLPAADLFKVMLMGIADSLTAVAQRAQEATH